MNKRIKTALISVSDKSKLKFLIKNLSKYKIKIISSGGTYKTINNYGYKCTEVSKFTNFPELLDGRVKTLHPKIHAGILSDRDNKKHMKDLKDQNFEEIDLVVCNFYPFDKVLKITNNNDKIVENIDVGGPTMVRAAAKNYKNVTVISSCDDYENLLKELKLRKGSTSLTFRRKMSEKAFMETGSYDASIFNYFSKVSKNIYPEKKLIVSTKVEELRYGENPHQTGAIYSLNENQKIKQLHGKMLSYNNYNDIYSALLISKSLPKNLGTVIVKHANPCGVSINKGKINSFKSALSCDPTSAFGGIVSCNFKLDEKTAKEINKIFFEIVLADGFDFKALKELKKKKNLRIIDSRSFRIKDFSNFTNNFNNLLTQSTDLKPFNLNNFKVVSKIKPSKKIMDNLMFAFNVCRFVKSNAIVITKDFSTVGIGSGQASRVDSCRIAINKLRSQNKNYKRDELYAASDAFFPFTDGIEELVLSGVKAIIQPSGSINDKEIIKFANKLGIILVFSKTRHFRH